METERHSRLHLLGPIRGEQFVVGADDDAGNEVKREVYPDAVAATKRLEPEADTPIVVNGE